MRVPQAVKEFIVKCILGAWWTAVSQSGCGREQLLSLCQRVNVMVPVGLPEQITSPNHLKRNVSSRTAIYRHTWWSHCLYINVSRSSGITGATGSTLFIAEQSLQFSAPCLSFWVVFMMFLQFTTLVETWLIGKNMAIHPHSTSLSACLPGWKPQTCLRGGETCRCVGGSRTRRRPATSSKHYSV